MTTTNTPTNTASASITNTITFTQTATITITPVPFPYVMNISVYNEAGELVKVIANTTTSQEAQQVQLLLNGSQTNVVSPGSGTPLTIQIPNIETPDQQKTSGVSFTWDGTNSAGQDVANGAYYIKETTTDPYGHTDIITKPITVINDSQYVQVNIYNSAGELVQTIQGAYNGSDQVSLNISNSSGADNYVFGVGKGAPAIIIGYTTTGANVTWNGQNSQGDYVASGVYEVQLVVKSSTGLSVVASKPITILDEGSGDVLGTVKSLPNPYTGTGATPLIFTWQPSAGGTIKIKIYNIAGELVRTLTGDLGAATINWDLKSVGGQQVSSGTYICVVSGADNNGNKTTKIVKMSAIIQAGQ
jgi:flagellar hook assembly protein FlgD